MISIFYDEISISEAQVRGKHVRPLALAKVFVRHCECPTHITVVCNLCKNIFTYFPLTDVWSLHLQHFDRLNHIETSQLRFQLAATRNLASDDASVGMRCVGGGLGGGTKGGLLT